MRAAEEQKLSELFRIHRSHTSSACVTCFLPHIIRELLGKAKRQYP